MNNNLHSIIKSFDSFSPSSDRVELLLSLSSYLREKLKTDSHIKLNFICTHNSRRSHLGQVWAHAIGRYFKIDNLTVYSGGTQATAVYFKVIETLSKQGFNIEIIEESTNSKYLLKADASDKGIVLFSKTYFDDFNPKSDFAAIMTCSDADTNCPLVPGAEARFPIKYKDPKAYDNDSQVDLKYEEKSLEIAAEIYWAFNQALS